MARHRISPTRTLILLLLALSLGWWIYFGTVFAASRNEVKQVVGSPMRATNTPVSTPTPTVLAAEPAFTAEPTPTATPVPTALPATFTLTVPYVNQAPFAKWDALHEDACEEASYLTVAYFLAGKATPSKAEADEGIKALVTLGEAHGQGLSITLSQLAELSRWYTAANPRTLGLTPAVSTKLQNGTVIPVESADSIKRELVAGHPVIVGAAGKLLKNSNFRNGGPNYHMLVIIGYDETGFITNDPGFRKGQNYRYSTDVLMNAIHDWDPTLITNGAKRALVFR